MSRLRNISREGWMVFTAVLTALAVIAAMIAVPGARAKAEAGGQPVEIKANTTLGSETAKSGEGDREWGTLTWAGERQEGAIFAGRYGNADNNVGWGWCVDISKHVPNAAGDVEPAYLLENARKAPIPEERRDAAINVATRMVQAAESGDKETAKNYSFYLGALIGEESLSNDGQFLVGSAPDMRYYIGDPASPMNMKSDSILSQTFAGYTGSADDFRKATGFKLVNGGRAWELEKDPSVDIPKAPDWAYITIVGQNGWYAMNRHGQADGVKWQRGQRIVTVDQPGLPDDGGDNPGDEGEESSTNPSPSSDVTPSEETETESEPTSPVTEPSSEEPTTEQETTEETTSDETPKSETSSSSTTEETDEPSTSPNTDIVPEPSPTPTTSEQKEEPRKPSIKTEAKFGGEAKQVVVGATVIDTVSYEDLVPGKKYTLKAELRDKVAGENGEYPIVGRGELVDFIPDAESGEVKVEIDVDKQLETPIAAAVAYEYLYSHEVNADGEDAPNGEGDGNLITTHDDITDRAQTVDTKWSPEIGTVAKLDKGNRVVEDATVIDTVTYEDLVPGKNYTLKAKLISKDDGETVLGEATHNFTAEKSAGSEDVVITVNDKAKNAVGAAVAFEKLFSSEVDADGKDISDSGEEVEIAKHENINDGDQTVDTTEWSPSIETKADLGEATQVSAGAVVKDTVTYTDLVPGKEYTLKAQLRNKAADESGEHAVIGEGAKTFTPKTSAGEVVVDIKVDDDFKGVAASAVAFEKLFSKQVDENGKDAPNEEGDGNLITTHEDIDDGDQTVGTTEWSPSIETVADLGEATQVSAGAVVKDTVTYTDLVPGKEYTLKAQLRNKAADDNGEHAVIGHGELTFTPKASAGEVVVDIKVDDDFKGVAASAVAFEKLFSKQVDENGKDAPNEEGDGNLITTHEDIDDGDQTVDTTEWSPSIGTKASKPEGTEIKAGAVVTDTVSYSDLVPGKEYTLRAELRSKVKDEVTGEYPVIGRGEWTFTPKKSFGEEKVEITVLPEVTEAVAEAVAFEYLTSTVVDKDGNETTTGERNDIAEHTNINDKAQTVNSDKPSEPSEPSKPSKPTEPCKPGDETTPAKPSEPTEPTQPGEETTEPTEPGEETTEPTEPTGETTEPCEPGEPGEETSQTSTPKTTTPKTTTTTTTTSDKPSKPSEPCKPGDETTPAKPSEPGEETTEPTQPGEETTEPTEPCEPGEETSKTTTPKTTTPKTTTTSDKPSKPSEPGEETTEPTEPTKPGKPEVPTSETTTTTVTSSKANEPGEPKISTNADFANGATEVVAGAQVNDKVTYEGLVSGKEYTLKAELISKADGKTVLGEGHKTFTPDAAKGEVVVEITVDESVTEPVEAAVAFEELTSVEVNDKGKETPGTDPEKPNHIADHKDITDKDQTVPKEEETTTSTEPCKPGDETTPAKPSEPGEETTEPTEPGEGTTEPGEPTGETTEPCKPDEPGTPTTEETTEPTEPTGETTKPTEPTGETTEPGNETETSETTEPTEPTGETTKPGQPGEPGEPETPTTTEEHKPGEPWVTTNADFAEGSHEVVAGAKVIDEVTYGGLVPGKEYTLKAELINKADGKTVLGTGEATFTPDAAEGMEPVTITVNDDVEGPVEAAVAFEELTSVEVNDKGEDTPDTDPEKPNHIADHKDINDKDQTVPKPGKPSETPGEGHGHGNGDGDDDDHGKGNGNGNGGSSKSDWPWWLLLIPGLGIVKIITDGHDGGHNGGHDGGNGDHDGGNGHNEVTEDNGHGGDHGDDRDVTVLDATPPEDAYPVEDAGQPLPSNAERVDIKSVPSGATKLDPGMQDFIK